MDILQFNVLHGMMGLLRGIVPDGQVISALPVKWPITNQLIFDIRQLKIFVFLSTDALTDIHQILFSPV